MIASSQKVYLAKPKAFEWRYQNCAPAYAAWLLGFAALSSNALALCDDSLYCTGFGTGALSSVTSGSGNTANGYSALYSNTTGGDNTASGGFALFSNTTGSGNTASGSVALISNTIGSGNTASGAAALYSNTTGGNNTASGSNALFSNTTGGDNTASGVFALFSNTTGRFNTASGAGTLYSNTTGSDNTASGHSALKANTTGRANTASGVQALPANTTGSSNTASGNGALYSNTTGSYNTASGSNALQTNTTGSGNTASGTDALYSNTTGGNNTASGDRSLRANTTGSNNIALGSNSGSVPRTGASNIHIGSAGVLGDTKVIRLGTQGTQLKAFIAGIRGVNVTGGAAVLVSSTGQLGVQSSSHKYKKDIHPMGDASAALMKLKPVTFRYKYEPEGDQNPPQYGLIAEDVDEVMPELVVRDEDGRPATVAYHVLPSLLLNEYQKQQNLLVETRHQMAGVESRYSKELALLRDELAARDKQLVSIQSEMQALRQVAQQLKAAMPSGNSVGMK